MIGCACAQIAAGAFGPAVYRLRVASIEGVVPAVHVCSLACSASAFLLAILVPTMQKDRKRLVCWEKHTCPPARDASSVVKKCQKMVITANSWLNFRDGRPRPSAPARQVSRLHGPSGAD